jgi:hypothetical protein
MKPHIRVALTADGHIEAAAGATHRLVIDERTGDVLSTNVSEGTDLFRWLVIAARAHKTPPVTFSADALDDIIRRRQ